MKGGIPSQNILSTIPPPFIQPHKIKSLCTDLQISRNPPVSAFCEIPINPANQAIFISYVEEAQYGIQRSIDLIYVKKCLYFFEVIH